MPCRACKSVVLGHHQVEGHGVGVQFPVTFDGLLAVAGLADHLPAGGGGHVLDDLPDDQGVIGDE